MKGTRRRRKERKRLEKMTHCGVVNNMHLNRGLKTNFKEMLSRSVCFLVYVPFYFVKGPVLESIRPKIWNISVWKKHANFVSLSVFLTQSFCLTDGCNNIANGNLSSAFRLAKRLTNF